MKEAKTGLGNALFSKVRLRVLGLLFGQPDRSFQSSELIKLAHSGTGAIQRELERLTNAGIISVIISTNRKLYQVNRASPIYDELRGIIIKTVGLLEPIRHALEQYRSKIEIAFVFGSIARGADTVNSDIDLMILGEGLAYSEVYATLQRAEKDLLRPVNPTIMTVADWRQKIERKNSFLRNIFKQPKLFVFGSENELERIGQSGADRAVEGRARRPR